MFGRLTQGVSSVLQELSGEERSDGDFQVSRQNLNNPCITIDFGSIQRNFLGIHIDIAITQIIILTVYKS